jgi:hypothetical protein
VIENFGPILLQVKIPIVYICTIIEINVMYECTHTHTHTHIYIYIYIFVLIVLVLWLWGVLSV